MSLNDDSCEKNSQKGQLEHAHLVVATGHRGSQELHKCIYLQFSQPFTLWTVHRITCSHLCANLWFKPHPLIKNYLYSLICKLDPTRSLHWHWLDWVWLAGPLLSIVYIATLYKVFLSWLFKGEEKWPILQPSTDVTVTFWHILYMYTSPLVWPFLKWDD